MWFFSTPQRIIYGQDALDGLDEITANHALIITDETLKKLGVIEPILSLLDGKDIKHTIFSDIEPEPSIPSAIKGKEIAETNDIDLIIAVGGGSVIDAAKAIWALYENPEMNIDEVFPEDPLFLRKKARLVTIPTTSGTGSDANWAIVIKDPDTKQKISVAHRALIPDIDILDTRFIKDMPKNLAASTGFDALTHAIEAATVEWKNDFSTSLSHRSIELILKYLSTSIKDPGNIEAKEKIHIAATMAGISFGNSQIGGTHAIGHAIGASFSLPHGEVIAIALPQMMRFCLTNESTVRLYSEIGYHAKISSTQNHTNNAKTLIEHIEQLRKDIGLKTGLSDFGITKETLDEHMDEIISFALSDTGALVNPCELTEDTIKQLCYSML